MSSVSLTPTQQAILTRRTKGADRPGQQGLRHPARDGVPHGLGDSLRDR